MMQVEIRKTVEHDDDPDLSYLGEFSNSPNVDAIPHGFQHCCNCREGIELVPANDDETGALWQHDTGAVPCDLADHENYDPDDPPLATPALESRTYEWFNPATEYGAQDYTRMASYGIYWWTVGVVVKVTLTDDNGFSREFVSGLWGIESDSDPTYIEDVARGVWHEMRDDVMASYTGDEDLDDLFDAVDLKD